MENLKQLSVRIDPATLQKIDEGTKHPRKVLLYQQIQQHWPQKSITQVLRQKQCSDETIRTCANPCEHRPFAPIALGAGRAFFGNAVRAKKSIARHPSLKH